jgi:hypothetical protein
MTPQVKAGWPITALTLGGLMPGCHEQHPGRPCSRTAPGGYCLPPRCYCGACPWWVPIESRATNTPDAFTQFDRAAVQSGKRRSRLRVVPGRGHTEGGLTQQPGPGK